MHLPWAQQADVWGCVMIYVSALLGQAPGSGQTAHPYSQPRGTQHLLHFPAPVSRARRAVLPVLGALWPCWGKADPGRYLVSRGAGWWPHMAVPLPIYGLTHGDPGHSDLVSAVWPPVAPLEGPSLPKMSGISSPDFSGFCGRICELTEQRCKWTWASGTSCPLSCRTPWSRLLEASAGGQLAAGREGAVQPGGNGSCPDAGDQAHGPASGRVAVCRLLPWRAQHG